jgi:hypothetical protein
MRPDLRSLSLFQSVHNKKVREQPRVAVDVILCIARDRKDALGESRRIVCADRRSWRARAGREIEPLDDPWQALAMCDDQPAAIRRGEAAAIICGSAAFGWDGLKKLRSL